MLRIKGYLIRLKQQLQFEQLPPSMLHLIMYPSPNINLVQKDVWSSNVKWHLAYTISQVIHILPREAIFLPQNYLCFTNLWLLSFTCWNFSIWLFEYHCPVFNYHRGILMKGFEIWPKPCSSLDSLMEIEPVCWTLLSIQGCAISHIKAVAKEE